MQNMISVARGEQTFKVFFDMNRETQDFENINVRDGNGEPVLTLYRADIEALKELIAEEVILATVQLTAAFKSGNINRC